jgi:hypothetical protein
MKTMKTATMTMLAAAFGLSAVTTYANYTISVSTSPTVTTSAGESGQSYFDVTFNGGGSFTYVSQNLWAVDQFSNPLLGSSSPFSSMTIDPTSTLKLGSGHTYASGNTYELLVDWTVSPTATSGSYGIYFNLFVNQPNGVRANAGATDIVNIQPTSVPEPSQTMAGSLVFGCGALVLGGRRWLAGRLRSA